MSDAPPEPRIEDVHPDSSTKRDDAAVAGRGFLVITGAKLWFMVGGTAITFGLPYIFERYGSDGRALYGQYYDLNNILSIFSMVMITGIMQTVSRFIAEQPETPGLVVKHARRLMFLIGGIVGGSFVIFAPWIAELRNNPGLVNGYRAAGVILFSYAIYTVYIGVLNGRKQFLRQALFDITFTTMKASLVLGLALAGLGVIGAFYGFASAAVVIMCLAVWKVGPGLQEGKRPEGLYGFAAQVMLYTLVFNLIFKLDGVLIKPAFTEFFAAQIGGWNESLGDVYAWLASQGDVSQAIRSNADRLMADYGMAVAISRLPWQATIAITFVVFPMVSASTFANDLKTTRLYVRQTMRYTMILVGCAAVVLMALPDVIFGVLPAGYKGGIEAMYWLAPAYFCFSLFNVINTLLMSAGRAGLALAIGLITVLTAVGLYTFMLEEVTSAQMLISRAGYSTLLAFSTGLLMGLVALWRLFGAPVPAGTVLRVGATAFALVYAADWLPEMSRFIGVLLALVIALCYMAALLILGEFGQEDRDRLRRMLGRPSS